jgi:hypothetical protein
MKDLKITQNKGKRETERERDHRTYRRIVRKWETEG